MSRIHLLIIDPQNDFMDLPSPARPALPVPGSLADMDRVVDLLATIDFSEVTITLDSHHAYGIDRPSFWKRPDGADVAPFTSVNVAMLESGEITTRDPANQARVLSTLRTLEAAGRSHTIWPAHCITGTWGFLVHEPLMAALTAWETERMRTVRSVFKGMNPFTESYSAVRAEVPDPADPTTQVNRALVDSAGGAGLLVVAGEAGSHCVKETVLHLLDELGSAFSSRLVLLRDCMSPVPGCEAQFEAFLADTSRQGATVCTAAEFKAGVASGKLGQCEPVGYTEQTPTP